MNLITTTTLHNLGIHKTDAEETALVEHFQQTLNERVGLTILDVLSDDQATELIELTEKGDESVTTAWLEKTVPEFDQVVQAEYDILMGELADSAEKM